MTRLCIAAALLMAVVLLLVPRSYAHAHKPAQAHSAKAVPPAAPKSGDVFGGVTDLDARVLAYTRALDVIVDCDAVAQSQFAASLKSEQQAKDVLRQGDAARGILPGSRQARVAARAFYADATAHDRARAGALETGNAAMAIAKRQLDILRGTPGLSSRYTEGERLPARFVLPRNGGKGYDDLPLLQPVQADADSAQ